MASAPSKSGLLASCGWPAGGAVPCTPRSCCDRACSLQKRVCCGPGQRRPGDPAAPAERAAVPQPCLGGEYRLQPHRHVMPYPVAGCEENWELAMLGTPGLPVEGVGGALPDLGRLAGRAPPRCRCPSCGRACGSSLERPRDHVVCSCGKEFCGVCHADHDAILHHGKHHHLPSCRFYEPHDGKPEFVAECPSCRANGEPCKLPRPKGEHATSAKGFSGRPTATVQRRGGA